VSIASGDAASSDGLARLIAIIEGHIGGTEVLGQLVTTGSLFPEPKIPGYRGYNLANARALVKQLGGLSFNYGTGQRCCRATGRGAAGALAGRGNARHVEQL
jgi:hypothetical protein